MNKEFARTLFILIELMYPSLWSIMHKTSYTRSNCRPGVSFTKLCDASYDQLTHRRSHELILLTNCYIALGCVAHMLLCVAPRAASCVGAQEPDIQTRCTNIFVKDPLV